MKQITKNLMLFILLTVAGMSYAQETAQTTSFSLQQAIDYAVKNSPSYMNAELDYKNSEYKKKEITGMGLPQIAGQIDIKDYLSIPTSLLPGVIVGQPEGTFVPVRFGTQYNSTAGLSASQLLFSSDYIFALKGSKEYINLSKINLYRSKTELVANVTKAYYITVITYDRIKALSANVERTKSTLATIRATNEQGLVELTDLERAELDYNNAIYEFDRITNGLINIEAMLKFQIGFKIQDKMTLTDSLSIDDREFKELDTKADYSRRADLMLLHSQQTLNDLDVKRQKWGYMPTLAAYGSYQYNAQRNKFDMLDGSLPWFKVAVVGVKLDLNIFDGLQRHYRIQQAKISYDKNVNTIRMMENNAEAEILTSSTAFSTAYKNYTHQKRSTDLSLHVYDVSVKKYESGVGSNLEMVTAQAQLISSQVNYYNAIYDLVIAKIDFERATGNLVKQ